jgi:hypothetical protein
MDVLKTRRTFDVGEVVHRRHHALRRGGPAGAVLGGVVVVRLGVNPAVLHDVLEALLHDATLAAVVAWGDAPRSARGGRR